MFDILNNGPYTEQSVNMSNVSDKYAQISLLLPSIIVKANQHITEKNYIVY